MCVRGRERRKMGWHNKKMRMEFVGEFRFILPSESHSHDFVVSLHVISWAMCITAEIKMSPTLLWVNQDAQDLSKPWKQPPYTIPSSLLHCAPSPTITILQLPNRIPRTLYARQDPCWESSEPEESSQYSCHLCKRLSLSTLQNKSQGFGLSYPIAYFIFLYLIYFWNCVPIFSIFSPPVDYMIH